MQKTYNDLVYAMAKRAGELAELSIFAIRSMAGTADTDYQRRQELLGQSKGELIDWILVEEFLEDNDKNIAEE